MTLVISETLKHHAGEGVKVALSPLVTDFPIILLTFFVLNSLSDMLPLLGGISILGGFFILYLAYESLRFSGAELAQSSGPPRSLAKGVIANLLNPNPYLFWLSIGGPLMMKSAQEGLLKPGLYLISFYCCLVGSKIAVALAVGKSKGFLKSGVYIYAIRGLGFVLVGFAILFLKNGLKNLGWI